MIDRDLIDAIHARLDECPDDWQARRELADLLEERGDLAGAACQRWLIEGRKRPARAAKAADGGRWQWWHGLMAPGSRHSLDWDLCRHVPAVLMEWDTRREAEAALAVALSRAGLIGQ